MPKFPNTRAPRGSGKTKEQMFDARVQQFTAYVNSTLIPANVDMSQVKGTPKMAKKIGVNKTIIDAYRRAQNYNV